MNKFVTNKCGQAMKIFYSSPSMLMKLQQQLRDRRFPIDPKLRVLKISPTSACMYSDGAKEEIRRSRWPNHEGPDLITRIMKSPGVDSCCPRITGNVCVTRVF